MIISIEFVSNLNTMCGDALEKLEDLSEYL